MIDRSSLHIYNVKTNIWIFQMPVFKVFVHVTIFDLYYNKTYSLVSILKQAD